MIKNIEKLQCFSEIQNIVRFMFVPLIHVLFGTVNIKMYKIFENNKFQG